MSILALLGGRRDRIETDVGKEDTGDPFENTLESIRGKGTPIARLDIERSDQNDQNYDGHFQQDHRVADFFRFVNPDDDKSRNQDVDHDCRQVENQFQTAEARSRFPCLKVPLELLARNAVGRLDRSPLGRSLRRTVVVLD